MAELNSCQPTSSMSNGVDSDDIEIGIRLILNCTLNGSSTSDVTPPLPSPRYNLVHVFVTSVILGVIILATIIGNVFVIAAIVLERNLRNVANYLVASLAVADLMVAALVMPLAAVNEVSARWFLGSEACDAFVLFDVICCTASILHLVAISLDRLWAVSRVDYIHNRSARRILTMIGASWSVSALISVPPLFGPRDTKQDPELTGVCLISQDWGYTVFSTIGAFYLPLLAMFIIYARIYRTARLRIRKRHFRRGPYTGAAGLVVAAAERLRDGASTCGVVQDSPTPQPLLNMTFFGSSVAADQQQNTSVGTMTRHQGLDESDQLIAVATNDGKQFAPLLPKLPSKNGSTFPTSRADDDDDVTGRECSASISGTLDDDGRNYSPATAVGTACSIIIAAAAATHQQQQPQQQQHQLMQNHQQPILADVDEADNTATSSICSPPMSADVQPPSTPFLVRFIDRYGWISMTTARHGQRLRYQKQLSTSSNCGFVSATPGNNDSDDGSMTYVAAGTGSVRSIPVSDSADSKPRVVMATAASSRRAREKQEQKRERKATRTLAVVTGTFVGCWLPFFILALVRPFCGEYCHYPPLLVSVIAWLGYVNSLLNPVIYTIFNPDFRSAFRKILFGKYHRAHGRGQMHALQHLPFARR